MAFFGLFGSKDKTSAEPPLKKRVRTMKCRKVSFVDCDFSELERDMKNSSSALLKLTPVNYYAVKNEYILALIYTSEDYSENYVQLKRISYEKQTHEGAVHSIDKITVSKVLAKVGIIINIDTSKI